MPFVATWIDLEIVTMSEDSRRKTLVHDIAYHVESKKQSK